MEDSARRDLDSDWPPCFHVRVGRLHDSDNSFKFPHTRPSSSPASKEPRQTRTRRSESGIRNDRPPAGRSAGGSEGIMSHVSLTRSGKIYVVVVVGGNDSAIIGSDRASRNVTTYFVCTYKFFSTGAVCHFVPQMSRSFE